MIKEVQLLFTQTPSKLYHFRFKMKKEVKSTANFLIHLIKLSNEIEKETRQKNKFFFRLYQKVMYKRKLKKLHHQLVKDLQKRFKHHWCPDFPYRLAEYRCIRIRDEYISPLIGESATKCGFNLSDLIQSFPKTLSIWIDPGRVEYALEDPFEDIYTLYDVKTKAKVWKHTSRSK